MTLIAAFRCNAGGHPGVVICADSQETYGDFRVAVDKIVPRDGGNYDLIIGGSGNIAVLIDGQADAIEHSVKRWPAKLSEEDAMARLERVLISYNARHVEHYPVSDEKYPEYKVMGFLVCVRDRTTSQIYLWRTEATKVERVADYSLLGWQEAVYDYQVKWLYYRGLWTTQAILIGIHLFSVAQNSLYIGRPTQVITVRADGMHVEKPEDIAVLEERMEVFNRGLAKLVLACPDPSIRHDEFAGYLSTFENEVMWLHADFKRIAFASELAFFTTNPEFYRGTPYPKYPIFLAGEKKEIVSPSLESEPQTSEDQP